MIRVVTLLLVLVAFSCWLWSRAVEFGVRFDRDGVDG